MLPFTAIFATSECSHYADWNVEADVSIASGWTAEVGGTVVLPEVIDWTSRAGSGALYDYIVVYDAALGTVRSLSVFRTSNGKPTKFSHSVYGPRRPACRGRS